MSLPLIRELLCTTRRRSGKDWVADLSTGKFAAGLLVTVAHDCARARRTGGARLRGRAPVPRAGDPRRGRAARRAHADAAQRVLARRQADRADRRAAPHAGRVAGDPAACSSMRSSPPRTTASSSTPASTGRAWCGPQRATSRRAACARAAARSPCSSRATPCSPSERTLRRKLKEVFLALRLEREFTKQEILTLYLNRIFLGQRAYGVGAAAQVYFDKRPAELTLAEAALIAGLPRSPSLDNPVASVERAHRRAGPTCCGACVETGKITRGGARRRPRPCRSSRACTARSSSSTRRTSRRWRASRWCACYGDAALTERLPGHDHGRQPAAGRGRCGRAPHHARVRPTARLPRPARPARWAGARRSGGDRRGAARVPGPRRPRGRRSSSRSRERGARRAPARRQSRRTRLGRPVVGTASTARRRGSVRRRSTAGEVLARRRGDLPRAAARRPPPPRASCRPSRARWWPSTPRDGAIVALVRRLRLRREQVQPRGAGAAPAGLRLQAVRLLGGAGAGLHAGEPDQRRADRAAGRRRHRGMAAAEHQQEASTGRPRCARRWCARATWCRSACCARPASVPRCATSARSASVREALPANLTLALGTGQVTPLEMARGYRGVRERRLPRDAVRRRARRRRAGPADLSRPRPAVACARLPDEPPAPQAISPANAFVMTDMMTDVIQRGTAQARQVARPHATSPARPARPTIGAMRGSSASTRTSSPPPGSASTRSVRSATTRKAAARRCRCGCTSWTEALRDRPEHRLPEPPGVVRMWVDRSSGRPTSAGCRRRGVRGVPRAVTCRRRRGGVRTTRSGAESVEPADGRRLAVLRDDRAMPADDPTRAPTCCARPWPKRRRASCASRAWTTSCSPSARRPSGSA